MPKTTAAAMRAEKDRARLVVLSIRSVFLLKVVPWRDMDGTRLAPAAFLDFGGIPEPLVLDQDAAVHGHADPRPSSRRAESASTTPSCRKTKRHAPRDRLVGDRRHVLGPPEDVHDVDPHVRRDLRERGIAGLPQDLSVIRVDRDDPVALRRAGSGRSRGTPGTDRASSRRRRSSRPPRGRGGSSRARSLARPRRRAGRRALPASGSR